MADSQPVFISAPVFVIDVTAINLVASFSELGGINSEVDAVEYIISSNSLGVQHTKQFGKTKPPEVQLKRGLDADGTGMKIWVWHQEIIKGTQGARTNATLTVRMPDGSSTPFNWTLENCWPKKIEVGGMKAGQSDIPLMSVTLACDNIMPV